MSHHKPKTIHFRGRREEVLEIISVRGRKYYVIETLSHRGVLKVFDYNGGPEGNYRLLYQIPQSKMDHQTKTIWKRLSGSQKNRNFPAIFDYSKVKNNFIIVTEWIEGTNLRDYLFAIREKRISRPSPTETIRLMRGLAHGVAHYYRRTQLVHGDISPANIMLTSGTSNLVLIDFGSAWPVEKGALREMGDGVTLPYAAPERLTKQAAEDFRADAFSVAVVAYELLTLTIPYEGLGGQAGRPELISKVEQSYRAPSTLLPGRNRLPQTSLQLLDGCLGTSLKLHPDLRFNSIQDWLTAWDELHLSLQRGNRLRFIDQWLLEGMKKVMNLFSQK